MSALNRWWARAASRLVVPVAGDRHARPGPGPGLYVTGGGALSASVRQRVGPPFGAAVSLSGAGSGDEPTSSPGAGGAVAPTAEPEAPLDWRAILRVAVLGAAVAFATRAVILFRAPEQPGLLASPVFWLVVAAALFGTATSGQPVEQPWVLATPAEPLGRRRQLLLFAVGLGLATIAAYAFHLLRQPTLVPAWLAAQGLFLACLLPRPVLHRPTWRDACEVVGVAAILAVAGWLRLWSNGTIPLNLHGDMASYALEARKLLAGSYDDFFGMGWAAIPLVGYWPTALSLLLFGDSLSGLNTMPALEGLASLLALYLLVRELWGWRPALFASMLAAGSITHVHFSRTAAYMDPVPWVAWGLYLFVRGLRRGRAWEFAAAGLAAGYAVHTYLSGRLLLPLLAAALALTALAAPRALRSRRHGLVLAAVGLILALGPSLVFFAGHLPAFNERAREVSIFSPDGWRHTAGRYGLAPTDTAGVLREQALRGTLTFWKYNDGSTQFGIERNLLDPVGGALLILGLGYAAWRFRRPAPLLLLAWLGGYVLSVSITGDPPFWPRMIGVTLPAAALGGLALDRALAHLPSSRDWRLLAVGLGLVVTVASLTTNWRDYLAFNADPRSAMPRAQIARFLMAQPPDYQVRLVSRDYSWADREFRFLLPNRPGESVDPATLQRGGTAWPDRPTIFILSPEYQGLAPALQQHYPSGRLVDGTIPPLTGVFYAFCTSTEDDACGPRAATAGSAPALPLAGGVALLALAAMVLSWLEPLRRIGRAALVDGANSRPPAGTPTSETGTRTSFTDALAPDRDGTTPDGAGTAEGEGATAIEGTRPTLATVAGGDRLLVARLVGAALAVGSAARATALLRAPDQPGLAQSPYLWLVLGAALFGLATWDLRSETPWATARPVGGIGSFREATGIGALILGGLAVAAYALGALDQPTVIALWLLAQVLWIGTFLPLPSGSLLHPRGRGAGGGRPTTRLTSHIWPGLAEVAAVLGVLVVAALLRLPDNASIPLNVHGDVGSHGLAARALLSSNPPDLFGVGFAQIPMLAFVPAAISFLALGDSLGSMNTVSGIEGLASLVGVYLIARELWGWRPALFALALLAGDITHIQYSRHVERMHSEVLVIWSLCLMVCALRRGRGWQFVAAGLLAGYAVQSYHSGRIVLALVGVAIALTALWAPRALWARRWGVAAALAGFLLALGPALVFYAEHPSVISARANEVTITNPAVFRHNAAKYGLAESDRVGVMIEQLKRSTLAFWKYNDTDTHFGIERNMLDPVAGTLLILGLGYAAFRLRSPGVVLVLVWMGGYLAGSTLTGDPPSSERLFGTVAPVAILAGLALHRALGLAIDIAPRDRHWAAAAVGLGLLVATVSGVRNWQDYLAWATDGRSALPRVQVARFVMAQAPACEVRIVSRQFGWTDREFQFLLPGRRGQSLDPDVVARGQVAWTDRPTIFVLTPETRELEAKLRERYPSGRLIDGSIPRSHGVFHAFCTQPGGTGCCAAPAR